MSFKMLSKLTGDKIQIEELNKFNKIDFTLDKREPNTMRQIQNSDGPEKEIAKFKKGTTTLGFKF